MTPKQVERVLTTRLSLKEPEFRLVRQGPFVNGSIISRTFHRMVDRERLDMIWKALEAEWGAKAKGIVGMILAYSPLEWNAEESVPAPASNKVRIARAG
jgi:hypothetical protein